MTFTPRFWLSAVAFMIWAGVRSGASPASLYRTSRAVQMRERTDPMKKLEEQAP